MAATTRELRSAVGAVGGRASWNASVNILEMLDRDSEDQEERVGRGRVQGAV